MFNHCTFIDNTFFEGIKALFTLMNMQVVTICISPHNQITISNCSIVYNAIYDCGKILYIDGQSDYDIQISNTVFVDNLVNDYIINVVVNSAEIDITASSLILWETKLHKVVSSYKRTLSSITIIMHSS